MKKKIVTFVLAVFSFACVYNVCLVSDSNKKLSNITIGDIEAIASDETSSNDCKESISSGRKETLSDGAYRIFIEYTCGNLPGGPCKSGTYVAYYSSDGNYIGGDDQRSSWYCF